mmetsp:Transcript_39711/g.119972  ORF Transcript_39711/g.119972 Transcript_39711/m.119972 type:complete len:224 (+) Transcript_39711:947-1618(+)
MRVEPPTNNTVLRSLLDSPESLVQSRQGFRVRSTRGPTSCSSLDLESWMLRCLGPVWSAVMNGRLTSVCTLLDSSTLAVSAASLRRCTASLSLDKSMPCDFLNSAMKWSQTTWSMSSPPSEVSPLVALTSNTPPEISRIEMSKVPPPRSYTAMVCPSDASMPNANAAAVGSLIILETSRPAILPASFVACRWASLKYAGTVTTAWETFPPACASAVSFIFSRT